MVTCSAVYCHNSSTLTKKFPGLSPKKMFNFPKDINCRKMWINAIKYANWTPTKNSRVCQAQFFHKTYIEGFLNGDQVRCLSKKGNNSRINWSSQTVKKALKLRFACGSSGNESLLHQGFDLRDMNTNLQIQLGVHKTEIKELKKKLKEKDVKIRDAESKLKYLDMHLSSVFKSDLMTFSSCKSSRSKIRICSYKNLKNSLHLRFVEELYVVSPMED
ncbi:uncharacterized protein [Lepeophtheirus salmonis]|uniref:uncharacterized protein n=1 Tax=Lepeophtheirus salmonis TaxID=72036 RepID=UPI003AF33BA5